MSPGKRQGVKSNPVRWFDTLAPVSLAVMTGQYMPRWLRTCLSNNTAPPLGQGNVLDTKTLKATQSMRSNILSNLLSHDNTDSPMTVTRVGHTIHLADLGRATSSPRCSKHHKHLPYSKFTTNSPKGPGVNAGESTNRMG